MHRRVGTRRWAASGLLILACGGRAVGHGGAEGGDGNTDSGNFHQGGGAGADTGGSRRGGAALPGAGSGGGAGASAGAGSVPAGGVGALPNAACREAVPDVPWPVIANCDDAGRLPRCAFPLQLNVPDYGPFIACCPPEQPFGCPNGTPNSCFATASQAAVACGADNCQLCVPL